MRRILVPAALCMVVLASALTTEPTEAALGVVTAIPTQPRPQTVAINTLTHRVYVVHDMPQPQAGVVTVINSQTNSVVTSISVGQTANNVAVDEGLNRVYVANIDSNSISVIDGGTNTVIDTIPIPCCLSTVSVDESSQRLIVGADRTVRVYNATNDTFMCASSQFALGGIYGVGVNPSNGRLYVQFEASPGGLGAIVLESNCGVLFNNIPTCNGGHAWRRILYNPVDSRFYAANVGGSSIGGYNGNTGAVEFCEDLGVGSLNDTALNEGGQRLYATRGAGPQGGVWRIDIAPPHAIEGLVAGFSLHGVVFDPSNCEIFAAVHEDTDPHEVWVASDAGACNPDTDGDGCPDAREGGPMHTTGGQRDLNSPWDFFDVPLPVAADPAPNGAKNTAVSIADVIGIVFYIGTFDGDAGSPPNSNGVRYDSLKDGDWFNSATGLMGSDGTVGADDKVGRQYDRTPSTTPGQPWRSGPPNGAVSIQDAIVALNQVGDDCN